MEASVILAKCSKNRGMYGVRIQRMEDGDWWRTWAFPIEERRARNEGYGCEAVRGNLRATGDYPGCPYCGSKGFVQCNTCHKITCWEGEHSKDCQWCGTRMENITPASDPFTVSGGDI